MQALMVWGVKLYFFFFNLSKYLRNHFCVQSGTKLEALMGMG
jgi:hypothetical protein